MSCYNWLKILLPEPDPEEVENINRDSVDAIHQMNSFGSPKKYMPDVHIKLKFGNDAEKNDLFKAIIYEVDRDFPFNPLRKPTDRAKFCNKCQGYFWNNVILEPGDIKKAARQAGMTKKGPDDIRIQNFVTSVRCGGTLVDKIVVEDTVA